VTLLGSRALAGQAAPMSTTGSSWLIAVPVNPGLS
jgi:hypothetical protein